MPLLHTWSLAVEEQFYLVFPLLLLALARLQRASLSQVSGLLAVPLFAYDGATPFPGLAAVPPCLGTVLILYSSESKPSSLGRLLAFKPAVGVGLISYSLYLWHWPLLVYSQHLFGNQLWPARFAKSIGSQRRVRRG
ncbi:MAG: peptidoglycan/LPS O-acetylase OafA/YrhL [Myxococcota bacterium]|jgi:peptidoglycan/LPS O-acetylase OafA/YrhL